MKNKNFVRKVYLFSGMSFCFIAQFAASGHSAEADPILTESNIYASKGADLDVKTHTAVFYGNVEVNDPRFQLWCDKLTIYPKKDAAKNATEEDVLPPADGAPPRHFKKKSTSTQSVGAPGAANLDKVIAEGNVVILQKSAVTESGAKMPVTPKGDKTSLAQAPQPETKVAMGKANWVEFNNQTGDVTLRGNPSVQQGQNVHIATDPKTVMILNRNSSLRTIGPSRTVLKQDQPKNAEGSSTNPSPNSDSNISSETPSEIGDHLNKKMGKKKNKGKTPSNIPAAQ